MAQVASHLGSGDRDLPALPRRRRRRASRAPGARVNQPIWDAWNAKAPADQIRDSLAVSAAFIEAADALDETSARPGGSRSSGCSWTWRRSCGCGSNEHTLHTWDVTVALDPASTLPEDAAAAVAENLGDGGRLDRQAVRRAGVGRGADDRSRAGLPPRPRTLAASRWRRRSDDTAAASLALPTEAFVRLVYGRLDPDHTPASVAADGVDLDLLRTVFPGL